MADIAKLVIGQVDGAFEERARDFLRDIANEQGFRVIRRELGHYVVDGLRVGTGRNAGLVFKRGPVYHAKKAGDIFDIFVDYFQRRGYEPGSYELFKPRFIAAGEQCGVVQDYFTEPSLRELWIYFHMRKMTEQMERKLQRSLNADEMYMVKGKSASNEGLELRCQQLLGEQPNAGITLKQMEEVLREFEADTDYLKLFLKHENIIVLGQRKDTDPERVGLAIIDI